jgi:hypothetical protein
VLAAGVCCFRVGTDKVISWIQCVVQVHFEAAMIACNIPANINRKICIRKMARWDNDLFDNITDSLLKRVRGFITL